MLVAAAYLQANNPGSGSAGAITANDASYIAKRMRVFGAGINYTFGPATVGFTYTNSNYQSPTGNGYLGTPSAIIAAGATVSAIKYQNFEVNGFYQMTPALSVGAAYTLSLENYNSSAGKAKPKIHQMGLMADYTLSKRTDAYVRPRISTSPATRRSRFSIKDSSWAPKLRHRRQIKSSCAWRCATSSECARFSVNHASPRARSSVRVSFDRPRARARVAAIFLSIGRRDSHL